MKGPFLLSNATSFSRRLVGAIALVLTAVTLLNAQAPVAKLRVMATPSTLINPISAVNDFVQATFRIMFDDPAINKAAMAKGVTSQKYVITFGDTAADGGVLDKAPPGEVKVPNIRLVTAKGEAILQKGKLSDKGYTLTFDASYKATITAAADTPLPREILIIGWFSTTGTKTVTLRADVTPRNATQPSTAQDKAVGLIVGNETLFLQDRNSRNFASDPPGQTNPLLVIAVPNQGVRQGSILFGVAAPDKRNNVEYDWTLKRSFDENPFRQGVFNAQTGYSKIEEHLPRANYTLLLKKKINGQVVPFTRQLKFRILAVELNIRGVDAKDKLEPGGFIPLNGGNVNKSKVMFGIPEKYDFEVNPLPDASLLVRATIVVGEVGVPPEGATAVRLRVENRGQARIRVWDTDKKATEFVLPKDWTLQQLPPEIWIEGMLEGARDREVFLTAELLQGEQVLGSDTNVLTVTPVLTDLKVTATKGGAPGLLRDPMSAALLIGSESGLAEKTDSFNLEAKAISQNLPGSLAFIQIVHNANNLPNNKGADLGGGTLRTYDFEGKDAGRWLLDTPGPIAII